MEACEARRRHWDKCCKTLLKLAALPPLWVPLLPGVLVPQLIRDQFACIQDT